MNLRHPLALQRLRLHTPTINMAGMLLCVFTTLAVLLSVSRDQSGAMVVEVTSAFNGELRDHGRSQLAALAASFREANAAVDDRVTKSRRGVHIPGISRRDDHSPATLQNEEAERFSNEKLRPKDINGPLFSHLMTELQRYCTVSPTDELGGQLALDLHSQIPQTQNSVRHSIERILKTCLTTKDSTRPLSAEFEVIVWASTPATEALAAASLEAFTLEQSLSRSLGAQSDAGISMRSSGRIWTRSHSPRPLATVVVRAAKRQTPSDLSRSPSRSGI